TEEFLMDAETKFRAGIVASGALILLVAVAFRGWIVELLPAPPPPTEASTQQAAPAPEIPYRTARIQWRRPRVALSYVAHQEQNYLKAYSVISQSAESSPPRLHPAASSAPFPGRRASLAV